MFFILTPVKTQPHFEEEIKNLFIPPLFFQ
jgi:hypothetical protein